MNTVANAYLFAAVFSQLSIFTADYLRHNCQDGWCRKYIWVAHSYSNCNKLLELVIHTYKLAPLHRFNLSYCGAAVYNHWSELVNWTGGLTLKIIVTHFNETHYSMNSHGNHDALASGHTIINAII